MTDNEKEFVKERNAALFSLNKKKIIKFAKKYGIDFDTNGLYFIASVYYVLLKIKETPPHLLRKADKWLNERPHLLKVLQDREKKEEVVNDPCN